MIKQTDWLGTPVYEIENEHLLAVLCPSIGNNLIRLYDKVKQREILRRPGNPQILHESPGHYGTPLMLPPGRIRNGKFQYHGRSYQMEINSGNHHIHGFLRSRPWQMETSSEKHGMVTITSSFATTDFPEIAAQYPHDLKIEVTYELRDHKLLHRAVIHNRGNEPAPVGYGLHTWFTLDGEPEKWTLRVPVAEKWELDPELIPTGPLLPLTPDENLPKGIGLKGTNFDTIYQVGGRPNTAVLERNDVALHYTASEPFKQWVVYTKGEADQWICLEPYTWVPNAPNLKASPEQTGLKTIRPGDKLQLEVSLDIVHQS